MRHCGWVFVGISGVILLAGSGCTSQQGRPSWGENALWPVDGHRIVEAARGALLDPQTWVPAAGALVFRIDDWDHKASDWASEHTPIFGSQDGARKASDDLLLGLSAEVPVTALATPSGDDPKEWATAKAKGLAVEGGAAGVNGLTTELLKGAVGRERPNGENNKSFPSGHGSGSFAAVALSNRNLDSIDMSPDVRRVCQIGNVGLASAVAWARVEGKVHYPSDVLAGAALGHFFAAFIYDAFMNLPKDSPVEVAITPLDGGGAVSVAFRF